MKYGSIRSLTLILGVFAASAQAQSPAELPPASYTGKQYVDSAGCVFFRISVDGKPTWVPRVDRTRAQVCGQAPSLARAAPPEDVKVVAVTPAPKPVAAKPRPAKRTVTVVKAWPRAQTAWVIRVQQTARPGLPVGTVLRKDEIPPGVRVVPRHVYEERKGTRVQVVAPEGYRPAFKDDRLNPRRAEMNRSGIYSTERVWTNTVPRKLKTGDEVSDSGYSVVPAPVVSSQGQLRGTVSSRSAPAASGHRYVQVGSFGQPANADRAARALKAAGLPVRYGRYRNGQGELRVVLAGPFGSKAEVQRALDAARRAGFRDAFSR